MKTDLNFASFLVLLAGTGLAHSQVLFTSTLDSSLGWTTVQEAAPSSLATYGYDYSALGIPASPNGGGSTVGLRLAANANGTVQAITAATVATFTGQYRIKFDFYGNSLGAFPTGGTGSTEFIGGGAGFSGAVPRAGASLLTTIEGGSASIDWRLDKGMSTQSVANAYNPSITTRDNSDAFLSAAFAGQTPPAFQQTTFPSSQTGTLQNGTTGFKWYVMQIDVDSVLGSAAFSILNPTTSAVTSIGTLSQTGGAVSVTGSGSLTLLDPFATSVSNVTLADDLVFALFDNYSVTQVPEPAGASLFGFVGLLCLRRRRR